MGEKEELIEEIQKTAEEKGFSIVPATLKNKNINELREELERIKKMPPIQGAIVRGGRIELVTEKKSPPRPKEQAEEVKVMKIVPTNPFNLPTGDRETVRKWLENNLDVVTSKEFRDWAYSEGGKKFLHKWATVSWELLEVLRDARKIKEGIEEETKWLEEKAGKPIGVKTNKRAKTMKELEEQLKKIKERKEQLMEREKQLTGFLELRKRSLEKMREAKKKLRKRR